MVGGKISPAISTVAADSYLWLILEQHNARTDHDVSLQRRISSQLDVHIAELGIWRRSQRRSRRRAALCRRRVGADRGRYLRLLNVGDGRGLCLRRRLHDDVHLFLARLRQLVLELSQPLWVLQVDGRLQHGHVDVQVLAEDFNFELQVELEVLFLVQFG